MAKWIWTVEYEVRTDDADGDWMRDQRTIASGADGQTAVDRLRKREMRIRYDRWDAAGEKVIARNAVKTAGFRLLALKRGDAIDM